MKSRSVVILAIAGGALLIALAVWLGLSSTAGYRDKARGAEAEVSKAQAERRNELCGSTATYDRLKELAFEEAVRQRAGDPASLDTLGASAVVRMENPVVRSRDGETGETLCAGRFVLELPPGAERAFGGERRLIADVNYAVQAAADGSGLVYRLDGAEAIVSRLAAFGLGGTRPAEPVVAEAAPLPLPSTAEPPPQAPPGEVVQPLPPSYRPSGPVRAQPSFNCRRARTAGERAVCASPALAAADRSMSSLYFSVIADADGETRRLLRDTRDRFLARRDRCGDDACIARTYEQRIREIETIAGG